MIAPTVIAITLIILVFLSQEADLYIKRGRTSELYLSLTIFSYPIRSEKKKKKRHKLSLNLAKRRAYSYLLRHSSVTALEFDPKPYQNTPLGFLLLIPIYIVGYSLIGLIKSKAGSFKLEHLSDNDDGYLEIKISFLLFHLIIFSLITLYYSIKYRIKRGR